MKPDPYFYVVNDEYTPISGALDTLAGAIALATFKLLEREENDALLVVGQDSKKWRTDVPCPFYFKIQPLSEWKAMVE